LTLMDWLHSLTY